MLSAHAGESDIIFPGPLPPTVFVISCWKCAHWFLVVPTEPELVPPFSVSLMREPSSRHVSLEAWLNSTRRGIPRCGLVRGKHPQSTIGHYRRISAHLRGCALSFDDSTRLSAKMVVRNLNLKLEILSFEASEFFAFCNWKSERILYIGFRVQSEGIFNLEILFRAIKEETNKKIQNHDNLVRERLQNGKNSFEML